MRNHQPSSESGSALWYILITIALLVALTLVITRSSETSQESGDRERARIAASDIMRQAKGIAATVEKMRLSGIAENDISFENPYAAGYTNANCTTGPCGLFFSSGEGISYKTPASDWLDQSESAQPLFGQWYVYATTCVPDVGTGDAATCTASASSTELLLGLPWVDKDLCIEINRLAGVSNLANPTRPPVISGSAYAASLDKFTGSFTAGGIISSAGNEFDGKQTGCFEGAASNPNGGYHFYQVLIAR